MDAGRRKLKSGAEGSLLWVLECFVLVFLLKYIPYFRSNNITFVLQKHNSNIDELRIIRYNNKVQTEWFSFSSFSIKQFTPRSFMIKPTLDILIYIKLSRYEYQCKNSTYGAIVLMRMQEYFSLCQTKSWKLV